MIVAGLCRFRAGSAGVVTWEQLLAIGMTEDRIDHRLRTGRLHRLHRGVDLLGNPSPARFARDLAAQLACEPRAVLADRSAGALYLAGCGELTPDEVADAIERGQVKRILTKPALEAALERAGRRPGVKLIRVLLSETVFTRSKAERKVLALIRAARLPEPEVNHPLDGDEIDFV